MPRNAFERAASPPAIGGNTLRSLSVLPTVPTPPAAIPPPPFALPTTFPGSPVIERLTYFAFDFDDIMRVNNIRNSGKIGLRVNQASRGFRDRSIWEKSNATTKAGLKRVMQAGVHRSGVVCVLIGSTTWMSFWVRYEIALAVIGKRGLVAVDLNSIQHHERRAVDPIGVNPLHFMGVYKEGGNWYLVERTIFETDAGPALRWVWYSEYRKPIDRPLYVPDVENTVMPLSDYAGRFDFMTQNGPADMGQWLEAGAKNAGR
jgi:hypothetical protein